MKKFLVLTLMAVGVVGCSNNSSNRKDGWTDANVSSYIASCAQKIAPGLVNPSDTNKAKQVCTCVVGKEDTTFTYAQATATPADPTVTAQVEQMLTDCGNQNGETFFMLIHRLSALNVSRDVARDDDALTKAIKKSLADPKKNAIRTKARRERQRLLDEADKKKKPVVATAPVTPTAPVVPPVVVPPVVAPDTKPAAPAGHAGVPAAETKEAPKGRDVAPAAGVPAAETKEAPKGRDVAPAAAVPAEHVNKASFKAGDDLTSAKEENSTNMSAYIDKVNGETNLNINFVDKATNRGVTIVLHNFDEKAPRAEYKGNAVDVTYATKTENGDVEYYSVGSTSPAEVTGITVENGVIKGNFIGNNVLATLGEDRLETNVSGKFDIKIEPKK